MRGDARGRRRTGPEQAVALVLVWALLSFGCGSETRQEEPGRRDVQQVADTTVVMTWRPAVPDTARLVPVTRIGRSDGPEEHLLWGRYPFTVGGHGEVYFADGDGIRVFSPDGSRVRRIAGRGEGPGEIRFVTGMAVDERGRLLAVDLGNARVAVYDTSGPVLDHWRRPIGRPGYGSSAVIPIPGGETLLPLNPALDPAGPPQAYPRPIFVRLDSAGAVLDTVFAPVRLAEKCPVLEDPHFSGGYWQDIREAMFPMVKWTASRAGEIIYGCPASYEVDRLQPDGRVLRILHHREPTLEPAPSRKAFIEGLEYGMSVTRGAWRWRGPEPPAERPYYDRVIVARDGRLWIWPGYPREPYEPAGFPGRTGWRRPSTGAFDVFAPDGTFLGVVPLPEGADYHPFPGAEDPFIAGDTIWLARRDSMDVLFIDRMLIRW